MTEYQRIAKQVGFTISQLAAIMGYTRKALYNIISGENHHERFRWALAVRAVRREIEWEYQRELDALNARYDQRRKAADDLLYINTVKEETVQEPIRKAEDCRYHTANSFWGAGCLGTKEIDPCKGDKCESWKPKEE